MSGFAAVGLFLISVVFGLLTFILWLRIGIRFIRISAINPMCQVIFTLTNPIIDPLSKLFGLKTLPGGRYDVITFAVLVLVELLKIIGICLLAFNALLPLSYILLYVVADLIIQPCNLLFYAIIIRVVMSYANPHWNHPAAGLLVAITEPLLILGRRIVPDISGFDFSPFIILMILKILTLFISHSLPYNLL